MKKSGDSFGRPATRGRSKSSMPLDKSSASKTDKGAKLSTLNSSATDEDFYSSLAEMAGDSFDGDDDEDSMTELDAKNLADTLAGMDDLDSDLFGDSLGRKPSPKNLSKTKPTTPSKSTPETLYTTPDISTSTKKATEKTENTSSKSGKKFNIDKYETLDFDEDDPLAGLLSDDEDTVTKSKAKKTTSKKTPAEKQPEPTPLPTEIERPKTSRSKKHESQSVDPLSPPVSPKSKAQNRQETLSPNTDKISISTPPESQDGSLAASPRPKGRRSPSKAVKNELSFDSGDDILPGIDDSPRQRPPSTGKTSGIASKRREQKAKVDNDLFGDDDGIFGLDEGKPVVKQTSSKPSRFDELLGGKKEKNEPKPQKPKTLDDFMSNISGGKSPDTQQPKKAPIHKDEEESFQFGGYTPSAAAAPGRSGSSLSRPDTAPGKRSVRFADDLGLDEDFLGPDRPSTAPSERKQAPVSRRRGLGDRKNSGGSSFDDNPLSKKVNKKEVNKGSDWLGLGGDDTGLELELPSYKPPSPAKTVAKKAENERTAQQTPSVQDATSRRDIGQGDAEGDDFLKMLVITPADQTQKSSLDGSARRGRRRRNQSAHEGDPLDLSSSFTGEIKASPKAQHKTQLADEKASDKVPRSDSTGHDQVMRDQRLEPALPREGLRDQRLESALPLQGLRDQRQEIPKTTALPQQGMRDQIPDITPSPALLPHQQNENIDISTSAQSPHNQMFPINRSQRPDSHLAPPQTHINSPTTIYPQGQYYSPSPDVTNQTQARTPQGHHITPSQYQSTPAYMPQGSQLVGQGVNKAQLEGEVQELMKRIHDMEGSTQRQQVDGAGYVAELEAKVRRLEMELNHLQTTLDCLKSRHQTEMANIETSNKAHIKTLEESYQLRESRIKEETDLQASHYKDRIRTLEDEKSAMQAAHMRKTQSLESSRANEVDRLKELHRKAIEEMRQENEEEIMHLRKLKEQEVSAAASAHSHTKSLQSLMEQVLNSTKDVSDMRFQIEATHKSSITERELAAKARDEYLTQLQERLVKQQAENDEERTRLQGLIAKMEIHMREQARQIDQERWRLTQEESRIKAIQSTLEDERRITMEQLAMERADVQRAREELLREQKRVTTELQEERRNISMERAQLSSAHREIITREKHKTDSTIQAEAELEITSSKIKEDAAALGVRQAKLKQEEEALAREKRDFNFRQEKYEEEKERIGKLSLEVQRRSEEIGQLCAEGAKAREEGEEALARAELLRRETENEKAELENQLIILQEKERQLAQDRVSIAHERRVLEMDKRNGRCRQCESNSTGSPLRNHDPSDGRVTSTPVISACDFDSPSQSPSRTLGTPDLLLNSLELKRNLRKWTNEKEKDEEFLEQESRFLNHLRNSRSSTKKRLSMTS